MFNYCARENHKKNLNAKGEMRHCFESRKYNMNKRNNASDNIANILL